MVICRPTFNMMKSIIARHSVTVCCLLVGIRDCLNKNQVDKSIRVRVSWESGGKATGGVGNQALEKKGKADLCGYRSGRSRLSVSPSYPGRSVTVRSPSIPPIRPHGPPTAHSGKSPRPRTPPSPIPQGDVGAGEGEVGLKMTWANCACK